MTEEKLERLIEQARQEGVKATDVETRRFAFRRMAQLMNSRPSIRTDISGVPERAGRPL
jgi:hypothetical protein